MEIRAVKTWIERGNLVEVDDDVLGVVGRIKALDDRLRVYYNEQGNEFDVVETCLDGTDRLVLSTPSLDERVVQRLVRADHWMGNEAPTHILPDEEDAFTQQERFNDSVEAERDETMRIGVKEFTERFAWAMEMDGRGMKAQILVPKDIGGSRRLR